MASVRRQKIQCSYSYINHKRPTFVVTKSLTISAADMYDMTALVSEVEMEIKAKVDENNVIEVFEAAQPTPTIGK